MRQILLILIYLLPFTSSCQSKNQYDSFKTTPKTLVLNYESFGPQVMAHELLGFQWWQWNAHGDSDPKTTYDIRVVVYKDISLDTVKDNYPVDEDKKLDFRYISYHQSILYLDSIIKEQNAGFNIKPFIKLRKQIISHFRNQDDTKKP